MNVTITYSNLIFEDKIPVQTLITSPVIKKSISPPDEIISKFLSDCAGRGMQHHTRETYHSNLKYFLGYVSCYFPESSPTAINEEILKSFLVHIRDEKRYSKSTINGYFATLFSFHEFMIYHKMIIYNPVASFRKRYMSLLKYRKGTTKDGTSRQLISNEDMARLIKEAEKKRHLVPEYRDACINILLAKTGIRKSELMRLDITDVDMKNKQLLIKPHPKRQNCIAFFDDEAKHYLELYIPHRNPNKPALIQTHMGGRLDRSKLANAVTYPARRIGLHKINGRLDQKFTMHCHRHWFTTVLRYASPPVDATHTKWLRGDVLGEAWNIYDHIDPAKLRKEYDRAMPRLFS